MRHFFVCKYQSDFYPFLYGSVPRQNSVAPVKLFEIAEDCSFVFHYLHQVLSNLETFVKDASSGEEQECYVGVFGKILGSSLDHEVLVTYFRNNNNEDIHEGGLSTNVIRLLKELDTCRDFLKEFETKG